MMQSSKDLVLAPDEPADLEAPVYALLVADIECWVCKSRTPTVALWVPTVLEVDEIEEPIKHGPSVLHYIQRLDIDTTAHLQSVAPWLKPAHTHTSGMDYLTHHCTTCGALQGDHFVFEPDGPYWPQDDAALACLKLVPGLGPLRAAASLSQSAWMERVNITP